MPKKTRFCNLDQTVIGKKNLWKVLKWKFSSKAKIWPKDIPNTCKPLISTQVEKHELFITLINHSTFLIQTKGLNILTDPVFSERVSPFQKIGPKRVRKAGIEIESLPKIDVIIISHNHYDHMDLDSLAYLQKTHSPLLIVPLGNAKNLRFLKTAHIVEMNWWQEYRFSQDHQITLTPAQHWSARGLFDNCLSLWGGFFISSHYHRLFFAGDTGYNTHFKEIRRRLGKVDISLLPIGAYEPRWFMKEAHMNPQDAVQAHIDLESTSSIGMHFGTFQLTDESIDDPVLDLKEALVKYGIKYEDFVAPLNGQTLRYERAIH